MCVPGHGSKTYGSPCFKQLGGYRKGLQTEGERRSDLHLERAFRGQGLGSPARSGQQRGKNRQVKVPFPAKGTRQGHKSG